MSPLIGMELLDSGGLPRGVIQAIAYDPSCRGWFALVVDPHGKLRSEFIHCGCAVRAPAPPAPEEPADAAP